MIRVYEPYIGPLEKQYVNEALDDGMLTFHGTFTKELEKKICDRFSVKHCILTSSGTTALYTVYEVAKRYICPTYYDNDRGKKPIAITSPMTYAATASQLVLADYDLRFVDFDNNLQIDIDALEKTVEYLNKIEKRSVSILVVPSVYGGMPDMERITILCKKHRIELIEDSAESFGCSQNGKYSGTFGLAGTYSFFANKLITCGEGGAIVTNDAGFAHGCRQFINQGVLKGYYHDSVGSNFRMTNLSAAIGTAQMENYDNIVKSKFDSHLQYFGKLDLKYGRLQTNCNSTYWMRPFEFPDGYEYEKFAKYMNEKGIEVRPIFRPLNKMAAFWGKCTTHFPKTREIDIDNKFFILPSGPFQSDKQINYIIDTVNNYNGE